MILQQPFAITPSGFVPTDIAGCNLWLKADAITGLNDGDPVASWTDQSVIGNHAIQSTLGNKPLYKTSIINSLPAVLFDGSNDFMLFTIGGTIVNRPASVFLVIQPTLNTASQKSYACFIGSSSGFFIVARLTTNFWGTFTTADLSSGNALTSGSNYLLENTVALNSTFLYQKGVQVATAAVTEASVSAALGKDGTNANREYAGYIAEVVVYDTVLSSGNRALVENYLIAKYAL